MQRYSVFLLDADDTLFDFSACCKNALRRGMEECGFSYREDYHEKYLKINDRLWRRLEKKDITHDQVCNIRFSEFLTLIGEDEKKGSQLNAAYVSALAEECVALPGAEEFLKELNTLGEVYIVTNGTASVQRRRFEKFGLWRYSRNIFISQELGVYKPAKEYFYRVAGEIPAFNEKKALFIGDSLTSDIALANAVGVDCVWYNPCQKPISGEAKPTYKAQTYDEILKIIKKT